MPGMLVILESTTYPGTTDEVVLPMLAKSGLEVGRDFFLCFSPERVDPGNPKYQTANIPKVVGGCTPACTEMGRLFYSQALEHVVPVSSTQVAEMVKLLENTFRMINIGLVNEMAMMCDRMGINVWEVIDAAATKPFGFMPFYPGPGLGGHCIPDRPVLPFLEDQAGRHRGALHRTGRIHQRPDAALRGRQGAERAERRRQAGQRIAHPHHGRGVQARYRRFARIARARRDSAACNAGAPSSPIATPTFRAAPGRPDLESMPEEAAAAADCVVIVTDHSSFDYPALWSVRASSWIPATL